MTPTPWRKPDLAPVLLELLIWGARDEKTKAPCALNENTVKNREAVLAEVRRRRQERDSTPLIPKLGGGGVARDLAPARENGLPIY